MTRTDAVRLFLLGMIAAAIMMMALQRGGAAWAVGDGGAMGGSSGGVIALANSDKSGLYLIHPEFKHIAFYQFDGSRLFLRAARSYEYDVYLKDAEGRIGVEEAKSLAKKSGATVQ